jgi:hypothetical protein
MPNFQKIILLSLILIFSFGCKKKDKENFLKNYDTTKLIGTWELIPSGGEKIIIEPGNKIRVIDEEGRSEEIYVRADKNGIRFLRAETDISPIGYFLFSEMKKNVWGGIWKKEVVRMEKVKPAKKSILE